MRTRPADDRRPLRVPPQHGVERVLMTADAVGGVWPYAVDLSSALIARGVSVTLAVMGPAPSPVLRKAATAAGIDVIAAPFALEWMKDPWADVDRAGAWLLALESQLHPDVVHLNGFCHAALPWRAPVVTVAHSCVCSWWRSVHGVQAPAEWAEYRARVSAGIEAARLIVAPTAAMLRALVVEYGEYGAIRQAKVIPNGRRRRRRHQPVTKRPFVFAAGRVWDQGKNILSLCRIARFLPWPVYVAGDARPPGNSAADFARQGPVMYLGRLEEQAVANWLDRAAIYALPARYEPFGLSVLEAARAGCALVLGDIVSLRENWSGAAVFVPPDDEAALQAAIRRLIQSERERTVLAARARVRARNFSLAKSAEAYLGAYRGMLVTSPQPSSPEPTLAA